MAKLYYKYGTMNSSKTANLLMVAHNYESQGRRILCLKSSLDTRWSCDALLKQGLIESRAKVPSHSCELVSDTDDVFKLIKEYNEDIKRKYSCKLAAILVDEAQFMTREQIQQLSLVVEKLDISVLCFGLKNTYKDGELFIGSSALLYYASSIEEIKTICKYCNSKATMNLRVVDGVATYSGADVVIGDVLGISDTYAQVCYNHYMYPPAPIVSSKMTYKRSSKTKYADRLTHILKYKNAYGFYRNYKNDCYTYSIIILAQRAEDFKKIKYFTIGDIMLNLDSFSKEFGRNNQITGQSIFDAIICFLYDFFESDIGTISTLLYSCSSPNIEFYMTDKELNTSKLNRNGKNLDKYRKLPDGSEYYMNLRSSDYSFFLEKLCCGITLLLNVEVGFLCE